MGTPSPKKESDSFSITEGIGLIILITASVIIFLLLVICILMYWLGKKSGQSNERKRVASAALVYSQTDEGDRALTRMSTPSAGASGSGGSGEEEEEADFQQGQGQGGGGLSSLKGPSERMLEMQDLNAGNSSTNLLTQPGSGVITTKRASPGAIDANSVGKEGLKGEKDVEEEAPAAFSGDEMLFGDTTTRTTKERDGDLDTSEFVEGGKGKETGDKVSEKEEEEEEEDVEREEERKENEESGDDEDDSMYEKGNGDEETTTGGGDAYETRKGVMTGNGLDTKGVVTGGIMDGTQGKNTIGN